MNELLIMFDLCNTSSGLNILLIVKTIFKLVCFLAPFLIMIVTFIQLFKVIISGKSDDLKDSWKMIVKRLIAGWIIFFIPAIISFAINSLVGDKEFNLFTCMDSATKERVEALRQKEEAEEEAKRKVQEKEDERLQKENYKKDQETRDKNKQVFEEWKKEHASNSDIAALAVRLSPTATPEGHLEQPEGNPWRQINDSRLNNFYAVMDATIGKYHDNNAYASCAQAAAGIIRATVDPDFNTAGPRKQIEYLQNNPKWELVTVVKTTDNVDEVCKPGDVLITGEGKSGHTMSYVGNELVRTKFPNSDGNMFQAAYNGEYAKYPSIDKVTKPDRNFNLYRPTGRGEFKNPFINVNDYIR